MWSCPYCGADVERAIVQHLAVVGLIQLTTIPFACPECTHALLCDLELDVIGAEAN